MRYALEMELHLVCRLKDRLCSLPIVHVVETMRTMPVQKMAQSPAFVIGVSLIRGEVTPVVDVASLLGAPESQHDRIVTVNAGGRRVALAVDSVLGVFEISTATISSLPPLLRNTTGDAVSTLSTLDHQLLHILNSARIVPDSLWEDLETQKSAG
ncbi:MAG: chemotaxis protein CheW [Acidobacteria bacterium]|nr:chemotaxis protein CheW [Acidobacteriota bacterium]